MDHTRSPRRAPRGVSILEAVVAMGLLGGAAFYMSQQMRAGVIGQRKIASLGEVEELRKALRLGIDCSRLQGFPTGSGLAPACHAGVGGVELRRANNTVLVANPLGAIGEYDVSVICPPPGPQGCNSPIPGSPPCPPGPAGCGAAAAGSPPCGQGLQFWYRNRNRPGEQDWKDLFGLNPVPCNHLFGGGGIPAAQVQGAQNVAAPICSGTNVGGLCDGPFYADIVFNPPFRGPPQVLVSGAAVSFQGGCVGNATDHTRVFAANITANGFRMFCAGSPLDASCGAYGGWFSRALCNWMAVGP